MQATKSLFTQFVGKVKKTDIVSPKWMGVLDTALEEAKAKDPRIKQAEIRGATPHPSNDDPGGARTHLSVIVKDENGKRIGTYHVHEDGTSELAQNSRGKSSSRSAEKARKAKSSETASQAEDQPKGQTGDQKGAT
ncbi:hypothetical protein MMC27_000763 [Xylographa pallens]|nr:hypothetical protein [Xylographa pallens]